MSTDKTLVDAQPGGRVRLGDQLPPLPASSAHCPATGEPLFSVAKMKLYAQAALSAQPSQSGQGDVLAAAAQAVIEAHDGDDFITDAQVESLRAALAACQPVGQIPAGFVLVPEKFGIPAEAWEGVEFVIGGPGTGEGEAYLDSTAWVGNLIQDDGSAVYGLHLSCDECPEEGSVTLSVFTARAEVQP